MINATLAATLCTIMLAWGLYGITCLGFGAWYIRWKHPTTCTARDLAAAYWVGLATLLGTLQIWHLLRPVNGWAHVILIGIGLLGFASTLPQRATSLSQIPRAKRFFFVLLLLPVAIWIADRAIDAGTFFDAGLYHIQAVEWITRYRIVPGLANLHWRFGFTSSLHLLAAFMDQGIWSGNANHLMNGFLLISLAGMIVRSFIHLVTGESTGPSEWLMAFCLIALPEWGTDAQISSLSSDIGVVVLTIIGAYYFLKMFENRENSADLGACAFVSVAAAAAAITTKASAVVLCGLLIFITILAYWKLASPGRERLRNAVACWVAAGVLIGVWIAHQVIYSGYPLYPSGLFGFPVGWRMPHDQIAFYERIFLDWGRWASYDDSRKDWSWIPRFLQIRVYPTYIIWKATIPFVAGVVSLLAAVAIWPRMRKLRPEWHAVFLVLLCVLAAMYSWFRSAPDTRYSSQIFFLFMACGFTLLTGVLIGMTPRIPLRWIGIGFALCLGIAPIAFYKYETSQGRYGFTFWVPPPTTGEFYPIPKVPPLKDYVTASGLHIFAPVKGDQVWNGPIPYTPEPRPGLRLRNPADMRHGFRQ